MACYYDQYRRFTEMKGPYIMLRWLIKNTKIFHKSDNQRISKCIVIYFIDMQSFIPFVKKVFLLHIF